MTRSSVAVVFGTVAVAGCILADPSTDLPTTQVLRPTILHGSVVPSTSAVLGTFPTSLVIPVELSDPTQSFEWSVSIDYNAVTGAGLVAPGNSTFDARNTQGRVRLLEVPLDPQNVDLNQCHVIQVVVALRLVSTSENRSAHTPTEPGGDLVTWFFSPEGDMRGCPPLDAGIDASILIPDADADAGAP